MVEENKAFVPYEENHKLLSLCFCVTVVPDNQASAVVELLEKNEAAVAFISHGKGTATSDFYEVLGIGEAKKQIVVTIIKKDKWPALKAALGERFSVSEYAKGISFIIPIDSLIGVSVYKMLANIQQLDKPNKPKKTLIGGQNK